MSLSLSFNATEVQPASADFEPIPAGWYQFVIEKSELKPTKAGTGSMVSVMAKVQGPTHANRVVFGQINYQNPNPQAQEIGQRQLSALCHAIGVMNLNNVAQLCGIPFEGRVKIAPPTYNVKGDVSSGVLYEAKNEFQGFRAVGAGGTASTAAAPAASAPAPMSAPVTAPVTTPAVDPAVAAAAQLAAAQAAVAAQTAPAVAAVDPAIAAAQAALAAAQAAAAAAPVVDPVAAAQAALAAAQAAAATAPVTTAATPEQPW